MQSLTFHTFYNHISVFILISQVPNIHNELHLAHPGEPVRGNLKKNTAKPLILEAPKTQNLDVSRLVLQLSLLNPLKPGLKSRKMM